VNLAMIAITKARRSFQRVDLADGAAFQPRRGLGRARAVSTRFDVPIESGRDILKTLARWRLSDGPPQVVNRN
jgi:hypothetical protein